jgi:uncharacterized membrane protein
MTLLNPELLWLAVPVVAAMVLASLRLGALARRRRITSLILQTLGVLLLIVSLAQPVTVKADNSFGLVVVLDSSRSLSDASRQQAVDFAKGVQAATRPGYDVRFVATGRQASLLTADEVTNGDWAGKTSPDTQATDLAAGLRLAGSLLGDTGRRRVVLVTDGWETTGQAADEAARLSARGIDLQVMGLTALGKPEVIAERLDMQQYARVGDTVTSDLYVYSTDATDATVNLTVDGAQVSSRSVSLQAGENTISFDQHVAAEGFHTVQATVEASADTSRENNQAIATLVVKPEPSVLVIEERSGEADPLVSVLRTRQMQVDLRLPSTIPPNSEDLDKYDSVVLDDVAATSFSLDQQRTLQEYVRRNGHGLVVVGGKDAFAPGDYLNSVFEDILPVSSQPAPRPQEGATALILIIDKSSSMRDFGENTYVSKFDMAVQAAQLAVNSLRTGDTVGVIAFDNDFEWAVPVQQINSDNDKARVDQMIGAIRIGRTTAIYPAVVEATHAMEKVSAPTRHLVLLTDGREQLQPDYTSILQELNQDNINLSTIGIGSDADRDLLTQLAQDGHGRYYFTEQPENIPKIVFKEVDLSLQQSTLEGTIQPHIAASSPVLNGFRPQDLPQIGGYDLTVPKSDAVTALITDAGDPLLAHWNYGLGRVVAYTSAIGPDWGQKWLNWNQLARFWDQTVRWSMSSPVSHLVQPSVTIQGLELGAAQEPAGGLNAQQNRQGVVGNGTGDQPAAVAHIAVESLNADNSFADLATVTAGVRSPSGVVTTTVLAQTAPGRYEADVPVGEQGAYEVRAQRQGSQSGSGDPTVSESVGFTVPTAPEFLNAGTNDRLLKRLNGGQAYITKPAQALDPTALRAVSQQSEPLWPYMIAAALLLLLGSVAARRVDYRRTKRLGAKG